MDTKKLNELSDVIDMTIIRAGFDPKNYPFFRDIFHDAVFGNIRNGCSLRVLPENVAELFCNVAIAVGRTQKKLETMPPDEAKVLSRHIEELTEVIYNSFE